MHGCHPCDTRVIRARCGFESRPGRHTLSSYLTHHVFCHNLKSEIDIHHFDRRYAVALQALRQESRLTSQNRSTITRFLEMLESEGIGVPRRCIYVYRLKHVGIILNKEFVDATVDDIRSLVTSIERSNLSDNTKYMMRIMLRRFYEWLRGTEDFPPEVKWIKASAGMKGRILPEELLTQDDGKALVDATERSRDRALILTLYETGGRIGEIG